LRTGGQRGLLPHRTSANIIAKSDQLPKELGEDPAAAVESNPSRNLRRNDVRKKSTPASMDAAIKKGWLQPSWRRPTWKSLSGYCSSSGWRFWSLFFLWKLVVGSQDK
jgi:hypothetical protein